MTDFPAFLRASLDLIAVEVPALSRALAQHLGRDVLEVVVDGASLAVSGGSSGLRVGTDASGAMVQIATRTPVIRALLVGEDTVLDALLADRLALTGAVDAIARFDRALFLYLNATVRSAGHPALMRRYLGTVGGA